MAVEAQIVHVTRKLNKAQGLRDGLLKNEEQLQLKVNGLHKELASVKRAADAAQGKRHFFSSWMVN